MPQTNGRTGNKVQRLGLLQHLAMIWHRCQSTARWIPRLSSAACRVKSQISKLRSGVLLYLPSTPVQLLLYGAPCTPSPVICVLLHQATHVTSVACSLLSTPLVGIKQVRKATEPQEHVPTLFVTIPGFCVARLLVLLWYTPSPWRQTKCYACNRV